MKKLSAVLLIIIFCCTSVAFPNAKKPKFKVSITLKQGKPIAKGNDAGKIGYQSTSYETKGNNTTIICSGNGIVVCPKPLISKVLQKNNDKIAEKIHRAIDDGFTNGEFVFGTFACTWKDGEKYTVKDRGHAVPVYNYHLDIEWDDNTLKTVNDLSIKVFPNPVQNRLTVEFSMPINDMVNIKIIDAEVSLHWQSETYVSDDTYTLPESVIHALKPGTYLIICTKDDAMISATFVKQ